MKRVRTLHAAWTGYGKNIVAALGRASTVGLDQPVAGIGDRRTTNGPDRRNISGLHLDKSDKWHELDPKSGEFPENLCAI
jgi:hypothetical protein